MTTRAIEVPTVFAGFDDYWQPFLGEPWGAIGQWLPIGAGGSLVRSAAYFDGNGATAAVTVLTAYAIGGLLLTVLGRRGLTRTTEPATERKSPELVPAG